MLEGTCKKCGEKSVGWGLREPQHQVCDCGGKIEVSEFTVTNDAGEQLIGEAEEAFVRQIRAGVLHFPQR